MGTRFLTFTREFGHYSRMSPSAYYMEQNYTPVAVRIYAEKAPKADAKFDIWDDGVSIFNNKVSKLMNLTTGIPTTAGSGTYVILHATENSEENAEDFIPDTILAEGSWVSCELLDPGGGDNFTVQFEVYSMAEERTQET